MYIYNDIYIYICNYIDIYGTGDGLKDDVYGGAVTQGKMMPRLPCGLGRDTIERGIPLGEGCRQPACTIYIYMYICICIFCMRIYIYIYIYMYKCPCV